jgi:hypothetical protein
VYPNGACPAFATILAVVSYGLVMYAIYSCHYFDVDLSLGGNPSNIPINLPNEVSFGFGLYSREAYEYSDAWGEWDEWNDLACHDWEEREKNYFFDSKFKAARAMGQLSSVFGFFIMIAIFSMACTSFTKMALKLLAFAAFVTGGLALLTLVALSSGICNDYSCDFSHSAAVAIAAGIMYFLTAIVVFLTPMAEVNRSVSNVPVTRVATTVAGSTKPPTGTVTVKQTLLPDGTTETIRTTYNADGTQTVAETIETPEMPAEHATYNVDGTQTAETPEMPTEHAVTGVRFEEEPRTSFGEKA